MGELHGRGVGVVAGHFSLAGGGTDELSSQGLYGVGAKSLIIYIFGSGDLIFVLGGYLILIE